MSTKQYLDLVTQILGAAILLSSAQWFTAIVQFRLDLVFGWRPKKRTFVVLFLVLRFLAGIVLLILPERIATIALLAVFVSDIAIYKFMRPILSAVFRMIHILCGLVIIGHAAGERIVPLTLGLIASTAMLSYVVTGITKLLSPGWRNGETLLRILNSRTNGCRPLFDWFKRHPRLLTINAWFVILFESLFPLLIFAGPTGAIAFCILAAAFHFSLAFIMGMNLFPLTWAATYPAIIFVSANMQKISGVVEKASTLSLLLIGWFILLVAWQLVAWLPQFKGRSKYAMHFLLYEFYMFAIRQPDAGARYGIISESDESPVLQSLPLPWKRRWTDGFWNPEHELKKAIRHVAYEINLSHARDTHLKRLNHWLCIREHLPAGVRLELAMVEEDSFGSQNIARARVFR